ncbi:hypothetical protein, partial [Haladaptatus sp. R4]|uniref:hypothetical protein n=1 Tax=Haladaptatus sp. R4 TaxID=1679489 RepID=UPI00168169C8
ESSLESGMSAMASANRCYGTGVKFLDVQVCLNSNGNIKASVGVFGLVADSIVIKPGQARRSGHVTTAIPGLPGVVQEFSTTWIVQWSGTTVRRVRVQATLKGWDFGRGWYKIASLDRVIID